MFNIQLQNPMNLLVMSREMQRAVPKAIDAAINSVAFDSQRALKANIPREVHTTNSFLKSSVAVNKAKNSSHKAEVGIMDRVKFAELLVEGGDRDPLNSKYIAVPIGARGANGRAKKTRKPRAILSQPGYFVATIHGRKGIWGSWQGHLSLMYLLVPKTEYEQYPYIHWERDVQQAAQASNYEQVYMQKLSSFLRVR